MHEHIYTYADITKPPRPPPRADPKPILPGLSLLAPLSRRGHGPGIILVVPSHHDHQRAHAPPIEGVPPLSKKWAEEGYVVAELQQPLLASRHDALEIAIAAIRESEHFDGSAKVGLVVFGEEAWNQAKPLIGHEASSVAGVVIYADNDNTNTNNTNTNNNNTNDDDITHHESPTSLPTLRHIAGGSPPPKLLSRTPASTSYHYHYHYPNAKSHRFALPPDPHFHYALESVSHTRNLSFLKPLMRGPFFDLEAIWDEHCHYEFADRSVEHTMSTMVDEPYVNHIPTLTGGVGRRDLADFYRHHFIFQNPEDTELELISRTVGVDRVVDEFIFKFTHDREIDWLLPGSIPPTGLRAEIPFTAIVNIRGDRLYHEHISWDQGTLLRQLGLLPDYLPYPHPLPEPAAGSKLAPRSSSSSSSSSSRRLEFRLPVAGAEAAQKMRQPRSAQSNQMLSHKPRDAAAATVAAVVAFGDDEAGVDR